MFITIFCIVKFYPNFKSGRLELFDSIFRLRTQEATEVAYVIFRDIICQYWAMIAILSDRRRNFMSRLVQALAE